MQKLPWLPRPLVIMVPINGVRTPCVQWHGIDSSGVVTEEQMLFPVIGADSKYIECVREDYWRVKYLGGVETWNKEFGDFFGCIDASRARPDNSIVFLRANELFSHATFSVNGFIVARAEEGRLFRPSVYHNLECEAELPKYDVDKFLQVGERSWRERYKKFPEDVVPDHLFDFIEEEISSRATLMYLHMLREEGAIQPGRT
ncbi:MAG: hypothetical protein QG653_674 [Patescibacteria group bacterium]|nr:hypothetical protein [Patescibacteria group bacterium]